MEIEHLSPALNIVIVGNGVAGVTAARTIKDKSPETRVSIYTDESHHYYPRPRLYEVLSGEAKPQEVYMFSEEWYKKKGINVHLNEKAVSVDVDKNELTLEGGSTVSYDKLLLANGGHSFVPPIKGAEKTGVFTLRTIKDALDIKEFTEKTEKVIVIGGGLLGLEFASSLRKLGQQVTVVELYSWLLPRQLDPDGATILKNRIKSRGIDIVLSAKTVEILGKETISGILLEGGQTISGDLVLISAGIRSNTELASDAAIKVNRGVVVDEHLRTSADDVYAVGDVAEFGGRVYGIIPAALEQATIAAANMLGEDSVYAGTVPSNTLKVVDVELASMGLINPEEPGYEEIKKADEKKGVYKKLVLDKGKIVGAILLGDKRGFMSIKKLMAHETDITKYKDSILEDDFDYKKVDNLT
ncbi:MAG TPA: NAD(P)/FAD-dependent oxidoreductase [Candidatus Bathyarchaeota archaeon]|nr:NAD(P)/FAD-dependent oxidoreductase [Candidatus Bathyarchaeota archaeon]